MEMLANDFVLSTVWLATLKQEFIGALLALPHEYEPEISEQVITPLLSVFNHLEEFAHQESVTGTLAEGKPWLHLLCIAVMPKARGKGIAKSLTQQALKETTTKFYGCYAEATSTTSQYVLAACGFNTVATQNWPIQPNQPNATGHTSWMYYKY